MAGAAELAGHFDIYIFRDSSRKTTRPPGEVPRLMRQGLEAREVAPDAIREINDEYEALDYALALCEEGDLLVVQPGLGRFNVVWKTILEAGR